MRLFKVFAFYTLLIAMSSCEDRASIQGTKDSTIQPPSLDFRNNVAFSDAIDTNALIDKVINKHYLAPVREEVEKHVQSRTDFERYLTTLDAYSKYIDAAKMQYTRTRRTLPRNGIGLDIIESNSKLLALPIKGGALYRAGLKTPHYLNAINGKSLRFNDFASYRFLATMKRNEQYTVEVITNPFSTGSTYKASVESIKRPLYTTQKEGDRVVLGIKEFSVDVQRYLYNFFEKNKKMQHLVLDLRHCIGGSPSLTIDALDYFLPANKKAASYRSEVISKDKAFFTAPVSHRLNVSTKVTVLVSEFTASSAELFIHALQYYRPNLTIIGKPTAGKCLVQDVFPLDNEDVLMLSVYDLLPPDGTSCEGNPIEVDKFVNDIELMSLKYILTNVLSYKTSFQDSSQDSFQDSLERF